MKSMKLRLSFPQAAADKPITWHFARDFDLRFSILQADIRAGGEGTLVMDVTGEEKTLEEAVRFARNEGVECEILSRSVVLDETLCVECGACTAVCARRALTVDPVTASVTFDNERCSLCEMCTHACPTGAVHLEFFRAAEKNAD